MSFTLPSSQLALIPFRRCRNRKFEDRRGWRRRRFTVRSNLFASPSPFESLFQNLIAHFPSVNSLDLIAPALGFASGAALYLSRGDSGIRGALREGSVSEIGEWVLFTSPTPFNRFVMLRCPSIAVPGSELLENVSESLVKEERHLVRINSGRIQVRKSEENFDEKLVYQRLCVSMEDGGVVSLDWPANLDLEEERGLDTTFLIVPGTVEGSMDEDIRGFVCDCLRRGCFPVVMNPRGCAGSPLTTARLFTAADSDDISTAIKFINKRRPWSSLMGIGWGYGANMLTKYLAEAGEETPLVAATCIDNPFDLEEATRRASPYFDQKLTSGLVDILQSNKELFQGRAKGFNVDKALVSTSIRDFEREISMVSYGFNAIEDFYAKSSTRDVVGRVKIPLLFIQNNDRSVPLYSVPQSSIAQNPFTSLLLCSRLPFTETMTSRSTISWCQNLTIEWLTAVELGLLKGRHPLLQDVDVTINPSSVTALLMRPSDGNAGVKKLLNLPNLDSLDVHGLGPSKETFEKSNTAASQRLLHEHKGTFVHGDCSDAKSGEEEVVNHNDGDRGQVLQAAQVVMNMLDVTMPDTLKEEQKKKVLTAVGQGETLINALQGAVPEDVRGKLTTAVSEIVHNQGSNLKLDGLLALGSIPYVTSRSKSAVQEKVRGGSSAEVENESLHSSDGVKAGNLQNSSNKGVSSADNRLEELESEWQASENLQKSDDTGQSQPMNSSSSMEKEEMTDLVDNNENADHSGGKTVLDSGTKENESKAGAEPESSNFSEGASAIENMDSEKYKMQLDGGKNQMDLKEESYNHSKEENVADSSGDKNKTMSNTQAEDKSTSPASPSETQVMEKEGSDNIKREEKSMQTNSNQSITNTPGFSVSQALDAFTSIDDSTQVAVNSVFHVLEDMITQLEEGKNDENKINDKYNRELEDPEEKNEYAETPPSDAIPLNNQSHTEEKSKEVHVSFGDSSADTKHSAERNEGNKQNFVNGKLSAEDSAQYLNTVSHNVPMYVIKDLHGDPLHKVNYLVSKARRTNSLDLDTTTALFLDYFPEDGQWKLLEQTENDVDSDEVVASHEGGHSQPKSKDIDIEPYYVILDSEKQREMIEKSNGNVEIGNEKLEEPSHIIRSIILDTLKVEVGRRLSSADMEEMEPELARDLEHIANAVSRGVGLDDRLTSVTKLEDTDSEKVGNLHGEHVVKAISSAVQNTSYLRRVLPVGVIVGSSLAALRKSFDVSAVENNGKSNEMILDQITKSEKGSDDVLSQNTNQKYELESSDLKTERRVESRNLNKSNTESRDDSGDSSKSIMVGAVTAALGASAFLLHHQENGTGNLSNPHNGKEDASTETHKLEDVDKTQDNIVTSLAEKAMSIASPVVPTKDGHVDQERLVAMLAELGQRGGILRFVGKFALLWGGLRGAMSLTDKLISFLRIAERPLFQRILAFICMVLVLWSPVAVPLLPTLVQSWTTHQPSKVAELVCIVGLYISVLLLVTLWGKRIRGYENPLEQYGLDLTSLSKVQDFIKGLIGGIILVLLIYSVNSLLGCVHLHFPITFTSSSSAALAWLKLFSQMVVLAVQGLATATGIAIVEELLFRSWLPDEIAPDLGYNRGIIISGLAFSLLQRSLWAVPGLWILSLALSGVRKRNRGSLSLPIGLRAGILASSFFLKTGGFLRFESKFPPWFTGPYSSHPFSGAIGLAFALLLAAVVYPIQLHKKNLCRTIRE
ncbi:uncharacterized protein LOC116006079 isoform X1 [Ipomoea triloba]|uniref:uncharacterized protein LOC116006079 isoform X1 n=2 Tax=Ipomoea triloba TaxID=35885 RepID=UPI00125E0811|nr:uncharacterized protein LOC116006079 isoform X1 [Ipomoea triloba]